MKKNRVKINDGCKKDKNHSFKCQSFLKNHIFDFVS